MKILILLWCVIAALIVGLSASGQSVTASGDTMITRPAQLTFLTPVGSNGLESWRISNNLSVNIIAGYSGGVEGVEFSSFLSVVKGNVKGAQFAGFGNTVLGSSHAGQFAGFYNVNRKELEGAQFAGFVNVIGADAKAGQFAGFTNVVHGHLIGIQAAGFVNVATNGLEGAQLSGFANVLHKDLTGIQASGFVNVVTGNVTGSQFAGFANVAAGNVTGTQVAGFVNYARTIKGSQIGFINIADSMTGVPIGFLSIVRHGYARLEIGGNETVWGALAVKTGTDRFYNIFTAGSRLIDGGYVWGYGYGFGTLAKLNDKFCFNADLVAWHLNENEAWTRDLNLLGKINTALVYSFNDNVEFFGGPTFNMHVSKLTNAEGRLVGSAAVPFDVWSDTANNGNILLRAYPGIHLGIRL